MNPPAYWALNVWMVVLGTRESRLGPAGLRGGGKRCPAYNRRTREVARVVERQSERVVVLGGRESRPQGEGPALHRCTGRMRRALMSAVSARSVSRARGVDRVRALQRVLYRCAKQDRDRRFHAVYDKVARSDVLWRAWGEVRANRGAAGVDAITIDDVVASGVGDFLDELAAGLRAGTYRPRPLRRVHIPKPGRPNQFRPLGIPTVADRVVMAAAKVVLEPIFEADFLPTSYGLRPGLSAHHALETVRRTVTWRDKGWALDADIRSCFDEIDSRRLGRPDRAAGVRSTDAEADPGLASGGGVRGRDRVRDRSGHPARVANLTVARKHRAARAR